MAAVETSCDYCHRPVFGTSAHPCCGYWMGMLGGDDCIACLTSLRLNREYLEALERKAQYAR